MNLLIFTPEQILAEKAKWVDEPVYAEWDWNSLAADHGDVHLVLCGASGPLARATLFWTHTPLFQGCPVGCIGHFGALNTDDGIHLLLEAERYLATKNISRLVGPMNGNTWREYRLQSYSDGSPLFFLEKAASEEYAACFIGAGYCLEHTYESLRGSLNEHRYHQDSTPLTERLSKLNLVLRSLNADDPLMDLSGIHQVSQVCFQANPYYTDLPLEIFLDQYTALLPLIPREHVLLLEEVGAGKASGRIVGFVFSCPDYNRQKLQGRSETAIVKTLAVLPEFRGLHLGNALLDSLADFLKKQGYEQWIHAFMLRDNLASKMAHSREMVCFREYALYAKELNHNPES